MRGILTRASPEISTPPLSPDLSSSGSSLNSICSQQNDALDFLLTLFPRQGLSALDHATIVTSPFHGLVLHLPRQPRTFYVRAETAYMHDRSASFLYSQTCTQLSSIVALLDVASEQLKCSALMIVLQRSSPDLGDILHSLMYVGGTVVTSPPFQVNPGFVLVGIEI